MKKMTNMMKKNIKMTNYTKMMTKINSQNDENKPKNDEYDDTCYCCTQGVQKKLTSCASLLVKCSGEYVSKFLV